MSEYVKVKWKSRQEILFNLGHYHRLNIDDRLVNWAYLVGGKEVNIIPVPVNKILSPKAKVCDLPVFETEEGRMVCGHVCEID